MNFAFILHELMTRGNVTQQQLAGYLDISQHTLRSFISGSGEPDFNTLERIAKYFSVTTDCLLGYDSNQILSLQEQKLLRLFGKLSAKSKITLLDIGEALLKNDK